MLCDRNPSVTLIPKCQHFFIGFATLPLFRCIASVVPKAKIMTDKLIENRNQWSEHADEVDLKQSYTRRDKGKLALTEKLWV